VNGNGMGNGEWGIVEWGVESECDRREEYVKGKEVAYLCGDHGANLIKLI
jgi:hypothetical protein